MAIEIHKSILPTGGGIGDQISSGIIGELMPMITSTQLTAGATISKKFYIKNTSLTDPIVGDLTLLSSSVPEFTVIIFASTGDSQLEGDLFGNETNQSPIAFNIPANSHASYWLQVQIPSSTSINDVYETIDLKISYT